MYAIAVIGDLCSIIPGLNIITDILTAMALYMAGHHQGVNIFSPDNVGLTIGTMIGEAIPGISIIPFWTLRVYFAKKAAKAAEQEQF